VVLYGDNNNWFACWAFWLMRMFGHKNVRLLDGGLRAWLKDGLPLSTDLPVFPAVPYEASEPCFESKAVTEDIFTAFFSPQTHCLLDVRSAGEYQGQILSPGVGTEAKCAVAGHIPTAINVPWNLNCNRDGTFKSPDDLRALYRSFGISQEKTVITYCAIGERSSLSWFVLKHLLRYEVVMNYDRSMSQWSRMTNAPIEKGAAA
jgi:thiosulfate/3-mercaptopyruvate sulfurtransferase